jgi:hypothetical protein
MSNTTTEFISQLRQYLHLEVCVSAAVIKVAAHSATYQIPDTIHQSIDTPYMFVVKHMALILLPVPFIGGRSSVVGTASRYGLRVLGLDHRWGGGVRDFLYPSGPAMKVTHLPLQWLSGSFPKG